MPTSNFMETLKMISYIFTFTMDLSFVVVLVRESTMWIRKYKQWEKHVDRYMKIAKKKEALTVDETLELFKLTNWHFSEKGKAIVTAYIWLLYAAFVLFVNFLETLMRFVGQA